MGVNKEGEIRYIIESNINFDDLFSFLFFNAKKKIVGQIIHRFEVFKNQAVSVTPYKDNFLLGQRFSTRRNSPRWDGSGFQMGKWGRKYLLLFHMLLSNLQQNKINLNTLTVYSMFCLLKHNTPIIY